MITTGYRNAKTGHCLREMVNPSRPSTLASDSRAIALILAPWAAFGLAMILFGG